MGLVFYLDTGGDDAHSGSSEGAAKAAGSSAGITGGHHIIDLSSNSPDLSGVIIGDTIRLAGRTDGRHGTDIFEITSVDDGSDSVTVTPTPASSGSGVTWAIGGAWQTFQRAMDVVSAGDRVWCRAGTYGHDPDADGVGAMIKQAGTPTAPVVFEGYKTTPGDGEGRDDDAYRAVLDGAAASLTDGFMPAASLASADLRYVFHNIRVTGCGTGVSFFTIQVSHITFRNVRIDGNDTGMVCGPFTLLEDCVIENNTFNGISSPSFAAVVGGRVARNGTGMFLFGPAIVTGVRLVGNTTAIAHAIGSETVIVIGNTFDGDGNGITGIHLNTDVPAIIVNNIFHDHETALLSQSNLRRSPLLRHNLLTQNATDRVNVEAGAGDIAADDPKFVDEAGGDHRLAFTSPARGAGWPAYHDIGAWPRRELAPAGPVNRGVQT